MVYITVQSCPIIYSGTCAGQPATTGYVEPTLRYSTSDHTTDTTTTDKRIANCSSTKLDRYFAALGLSVCRIGCWVARDPHASPSADNMI